MMTLQRLQAIRRSDGKRVFYGKMGWHRDQNLSYNCASAAQIKLWIEEMANDRHILNLRAVPISQSDDRSVQVDAGARSKSARRPSSASMRGAKQATNTATSVRG